MARWTKRNVNIRLALTVTVPCTQKYPLALCSAPGGREGHDDPWEPVIQ